jgi:stearoyl-CoA desaturase (delta-9 desaturase)
MDLTFYILRALSVVRVVGGLKPPPIAVIRNEQRLGAKIIGRSATRLAERYNPERIAHSLRSVLPDYELAALLEALEHTQERVAARWAEVASHMPSREDMLVEARKLFAKTPSMEEIVDRAHRLVLHAVGRQLSANAATA